MHILTLVDCYLPSCKSGAKQIADLAGEFLRRGHEVTVLTASHEISRDLEISTENGVRIARIRTAQIKGASNFRRALNEIRISSVAWRKAGSFLARRPADLIVYYSPTIFWGALVRRLKEMWHCRSYLILRDIFPQWALDAGVLRPGIVYRYFRKKESDQYAAADVIGVQSQGDLQYFSQEYGGAGYEVEVLHNWTRLEEPNLPKTDFRTRLGLKEKIVLFYGGNLGVAQDVNNMLRLAAKLAGDPRLFLLLVGEGSAADRLEQTIAEKRLPNIRRLGAVDQREYLSMVSEFDVGLISLDRRLKNNNIPGKLLSYFYWGLPVLASVNPGNDLQKLLEESSAGICVENGEDEKLAAAALQLANDPQQRQNMGRNGRNLLEQKFSVEAAAHQILRHVSSSPTRSGSLIVLPAVREPIPS